MNPSLVLASGVLLVAASCLVYTGSFASLHTPETTKALRREQGLKETDDDEDEQTQGLDSGSAWMFPVLGSAVLLTLFLAFKYFEKETILFMVNMYFAVAGSFAMPALLIHLYKMARGPHSLDHWTKQALKFKSDLAWSTPSTNKNLMTANFHVSKAAMVLFGVIVVLMAAYLYTKHWILANFVAMGFALQGMSFITLDTFKTGFILLGGLFLYDIFWVFGSTKFAGQSVMVNVATNFDGPIKILAPRNILPVIESVREQGWANKRPFEFSLLGLGDIVVPGVFIALALAFDQHHASSKSPSLSFTRFFYRFPKPYFHACMAGYVLGLFATMCVMHIFQAGQPALLYLSPSCSFAAIFVAWRRGEVKELLEWVNPASDEAKASNAEADKKTQ